MDGEPTVLPGGVSMRPPMGSGVELSRLVVVSGLGLLSEDSPVAFEHVLGTGEEME